MELRAGSGFDMDRFLCPPRSRDDYSIYMSQMFCMIQMSQVVRLRICIYTDHCTVYAFITNCCLHHENSKYMPSPLSMPAVWNNDGVHVALDSASMRCVRREDLSSC